MGTRKEKKQKYRSKKKKKTNRSFEQNTGNGRYFGMEINDPDAIALTRLFAQMDPKTTLITMSEEVMNREKRIEHAPDRALRSVWNQNFAIDYLHNWMIHYGPNQIFADVLGKISDSDLNCRICDLNEDIQYQIWHGFRSSRALSVADDDHDKMIHPYTERQAETLKEYSGREHIARTENRMLREAAIQAEMDLEYMKIPFGWIEQVKICDLGDRTDGIVIRKEKKANRFEELPEDLQKRLNRCDWKTRGRGADGMPEGPVREEVDTFHEIIPDYMYPIILEVSQSFFEKHNNAEDLYYLLMWMYIRTAYNCYKGILVDRQTGIYKDRFEQVFEDRLNVNDYKVDIQMSQQEQLSQDRQDAAWNLVKAFADYMEKAGKDLNASGNPVFENFKSGQPFQPQENREEDYAEYPYLVQCQRCGKIFGRKRRSKVIQHPELYCCPDCNGEIKRIR